MCHACSTHLTIISWPSSRRNRRAPASRSSSRASTTTSAAAIASPSQDHEEKLADIDQNVLRKIVEASVKEMARMKKEGVAS